MKAEQHIVLLGSGGQLGWELNRTLGPLGEVTALDYPAIDFRHPERLRRSLENASPSIIVNAVAYTNVDQAEADPETARAINGEAPGLLAGTARALDALLIHYSTDYVFDGSKGAPYTEEDEPAPLNVYGRTKLEGEQAIQAIDHPYLILRTSWVYSFRRPSFATKVLRWARSQSTMRVVTDQVGSPTWSRALAEATALLLAGLGGDSLKNLGHRSGIFHVAGRGSASRYQFAKTLLELDPRSELHKVHELQKAQSSDFPAPATRPANSSLECNRFEAAFGLALPRWEDALRLALDHFPPAEI